MKNLKPDIPAVLCGAAIGLLAPGAPALAQDRATVIELTQVACQFIESENGINRNYTTKRKADCDRINERTAAQRLAEAKPLVLKPGKYVFKVTNKNVPYELGFWLRGDGVANRALLPSVSGGGMTLGKTNVYEIELKPGDYVYSCPLNTTPDYKLKVQR
jgi:hypothetical protein